MPLYLWAVLHNVLFPENCLTSTFLGAVTAYRTNVKPGLCKKLRNKGSSDHGDSVATVAKATIRYVLEFAMERAGRTVRCVQRRLV